VFGPLVLFGLGGAATAASSVPSLWITPVIICVLWIAIQLGLGYRHRHHGA
jgi:hypothetical protein